MTTNAPQDASFPGRTSNSPAATPDPPQGHPPLSDSSVTSLGGHLEFVCFRCGKRHPHWYAIYACFLRHERKR